MLVNVNGGTPTPNVPVTVTVDGINGLTGAGSHEITVTPEDERQEIGVLTLKTPIKDKEYVIDGDVRVSYTPATIEQGRIVLDNVAGSTEYSVTVGGVKVADVTSKSAVAQQKYIVVEQPTTSKQEYTFSNGPDKVTYTSNEARQGIHEVTVTKPTDINGVVNSGRTVSIDGPSYVTFEKPLTTNVDAGLLLSLIHI